MEKILIIDDDMQLTELLNEFLSSYCSLGTED